MLQIGPYSLENSVALAPMAGVTDLPFRRLCRRLGAGLVVSEMVTSDARLFDSRKTRLRMDHSGENEPRSVQIAGGDAEMLAQAARFNVEHGAQIIDINMGCPAKKVCRKAAGSALMKDEQLVEQILRAVVEAVSVPVTLKIRTGWQVEHRNGPVIAQIAENAGIAMLAVHGRTRACRFEGSAEYDTIASICSSVKIPVLANGDIDSPQKARDVLNATGAAGVMIGRAAQGRPWLCGQIAHYLSHGELLAEPERDLRAQILLDHLGQLHLFYGTHQGVRVARKHVAWYLQNEPGAADFKRHFNTIDDAAQQHRLLEHYYKNSQHEELAA